MTIRSVNLAQILVACLGLCLLATTVRATTTAPESLTITPSEATICAGNSVDLSVDGCVEGTVRWQTGEQTAHIEVRPVATTVYSVSCTASADQVVSSLTALVTVNPTPVIGNNSQTICAGETLDLTQLIVGYETLLQPLFRVGNSAGTAVTDPTGVSPAATGTYFLTARNSSGCSGTATVSIAVNSLPVANVVSLSACADGNGLGQFDLRSLTDRITNAAPDSEVTFFADAFGQTPIDTPAAYRQNSGTVYADVRNNQQTGCSVSVPVTLLALSCACPDNDCLPIQVRIVRQGR